LTYNPIIGYKIQFEKYFIYEIEQSNLLPLFQWGGNQEEGERQWG
jgi:hypothetical protein